MSVRSKKYQVAEHAIVIAAQLLQQSDEAVATSLAEVTRLAATLGIEVVDHLVQRRVSIDAL